MSASSHLLDASLWAYVALAVLSGGAVRLLYRQHKMFMQMPPGPKGLPLVGNVFQFSLSPMWIQLTAWAEEFGPIYSFNVAGHPVIVLNKISVAADLFDRRSHIYNDRPRMIMAGELTCKNMFMPFSPTSPMWQRWRKVAQEGLSTRALRASQHLQQREAAMLLYKFCQDPGCWEENVKRSAASNIISLIYGWAPVRDLSHPVIQKIYEAADAILEACLPGSSFVDMFPALLYIPAPLSVWKTKGNNVFNRITTVFHEMLETASKPDREHELCFASKLKNKDNGFSDIEATWLPGSLFLAGSETTASSLATFLLAMITHPEVMRRGQAEIDRVVGRSRLPTLADQDELPYITAIVKETLRWRAAAPVGMPRKATQDDWYHGYLIPKGATVIANVWAMHRDEELYPEHDIFRPERFLTEDGHLNSPIPDTHGQGHVSYGFGRRICVGMHMTNQKLFLDVASVLWAFNIQNASNELPDTEFVDSGAAAHPKPFKCALTPRFSDVKTIVESVMASDDKE